MSIHGIIDTVAVSLGAKFMPKYFWESAESASLAETLAELSLTLPAKHPLTTALRAFSLSGR